MRPLLLAFLLACRADAAPAPIAWKPLSTGPVIAEVFADSRGVWRCTRGSCEHHTWAGDVTKRTLACETRTFASSPRGTWVAQACDGKVALTPMLGGAPLTQPEPCKSVDEVIVDDRGTVTATCGAIVARVDVKGAVVGPRTLALPADALAPEKSATLHPANGPWLAYTDGAYAKEVAWRADAKQVALGGGALFNGDQMWVSLMTNGYVRMTEKGPVKVKGRFGAGLPGYGILLDVVPWGADGLLVQYEQAIVLVDRELVTKRQLLTPNAKGTYGRAGSDPSGTKLFFVAADGAITVASL